MRRLIRRIGVYLLAIWAAVTILYIARRAGWRWGTQAELEPRGFEVRPIP